jgi:DNA invertase Pin-like site-specific DNA recombinase
VSPKRIAKPLDIYIRVSDVRGRSGESFISPRDQEERCLALARARGYEIGEVFEELDVSGGNMRRPKLEEAIDRVEAGVSAGIIVAKLDRFSRTLVGGLQTLERINELGGVVIVADGEFDTSTATGELVLHMMLSLAQFELRRIRENWQSNKSHAVDRGIHISPRVPPGYTRVESDNGVSAKTGRRRRKIEGPLAPDPEHAEAVREAFQMAAAGEPYARIAALLNEHKVPSGDTAVVWQGNRIKRLLANRVYLGEARSGNGHVNLDAHEPLTDEATFLLAQRKPDRVATPAAAVSVLAGLCRCATCSFSMKGQIRKGGALSIYRCPTSTVHGRCDRPVSVAMEKLDEYVIDAFLARSGSLQLTQVPESDDVARLEAAAAEAERRYTAALTNVELRAQLGDADHDSMLIALRHARDDAQEAVPRRLRKPSSAPLASADLAALVEELRRRGDVVSLRELLASGIQAVFVRPAASRSHSLPISDRVHIVWADEEPLVLPRRGERFEPRAYAW